MKCSPLPSWHPAPLSPSLWPLPDSPADAKGDAPRASTKMTGGHLCPLKPAIWGMSLRMVKNCPIWDSFFTAGPTMAMNCWFLLPCNFAKQTPQDIFVYSPCCYITFSRHGWRPDMIGFAFPCSSLYAWEVSPPLASLPPYGISPPQPCLLLFPLFLFVSLDDCLSLPSSSIWKLTKLVSGPKYSLFQSVTILSGCVRKYMLSARTLPHYFLQFWYRQNLFFSWLSLRKLIWPKNEFKL